MDLWRSKPELISVPISELKQRKIAILLCWSLEMDAGETRQVEKLDEPLLKFKNVDYYVDTRQHASEYPYEYLAITFQTDKARSKLLRDHGVQRFPLQKKRTVNFKSSTEYIIFALDLEETDFARLDFKIGTASIGRIRALLEKRSLRLAHYLDSGKDGFLSWEPLHELLSKSTATSGKSSTIGRIGPRFSYAAGCLTL